MDEEARWFRAFHLLFYACLAIPALTGREGGAPAWAVAAVMALYYWLFVVRGRDRFERLHPMGWHLTVLIALMAVLIVLDPAFDTLIFGMLSLPYVMLPGRWAYGGAAVLVTTAFSAGGGLAEISQAPSRAVSLLAGIALAVLMGLFVNFLVKAGERNKELGVLEERTRLAGEIHDTLAQGFSGVITQLEAAEQAGDDLAAVRERIASAKRLARESLAEARRSVHQLRPEALQRERLDLALAGVARRWSARTGVRARLAVSGPPRPLDPDVEVVLLRAAQEGLANVARHARATSVALTLTYMDGEVTLDVLDDGAGFDGAGLDGLSIDGAGPGGAGGEGGYGLTAMRERAARVGGAVTVESARGEGTALCVSIPCA
ncbi:sensor histidine kinase [Nonomuraea dietziae]|uniref:sensor histidine kinase n=1 Tax=Nonomuraea dietziae TaxID=65515 RepID=UPI0033FB23B5